MATSVISNTITDPTGAAISGVPVTVTLMPTAGFRVSDASEVARTVSTTTDGSGVWSLALEQTSNITPSSTYYEVVEFIPAASGGTRVWTIQVGNSNQTVSAALVTPLPAAQASGFLTQAAADARYQALGAFGSVVAETAGAAGTSGVSTSASRADHVHAAAVAAPTTVNADGSASVSTGVATTFAASDHGHTLANTGWTSYTPTLTQGGAVTNTVNYAKYIRIGRTIIFSVNLSVTGTGTANNTVTVSLPPVTAANATGGVTPIGSGFIGSGGLNYAGTAVLITTSTAALIVGTTGASYAGHTNGVFTGALVNANTFGVFGTYEAAS